MREWVDIKVFIREARSILFYFSVVLLSKIYNNPLPFLFYGVFSDYLGLDINLFRDVLYIIDFNLG